MQAGTAIADITTDDPQVRVADRMLARCLVLQDGNTTAAIVALDAVAVGGIEDVSDRLLPELRVQVETVLGIPGGHVLISATHTHPPGPRLCPHEEQLERIFAALRTARGNLVPVTVGSGSGHEDRIMMNRTLRLKDGRQWTVRHANPCPPDDLVAGLGPVDPEIGIVRLDRTDGRPLAVIYNFAAHPYLGVPGGGVTADFPGFASRLIEEQLAGGLALFLQGAAGDITSILYKDVHRPRDAEPLGTMLGLSTLRAWRRIETGPATLSVRTTAIALPRRTDVPERVAALQSEQQTLLDSLRFTSLNFRTFLPLFLQYTLNPEYPSAYAHRYLHAAQRGSDEWSAIDAQNRDDLDKYRANIRAMERLARIQDQLATLRRHQADNDAAGEPTVAAEVQAIRIGDCALVTAPAELLVEIGLRLKQASPWPTTLVAAFANGYLHYAAPAAYYELGSYEVTECLLGPGWQALYEQAASDLLRGL